MIALSSPIFLALALQNGSDVATQNSSPLSEYFINPFVLLIFFFFLLGFVRIIRYLLALPTQNSALRKVNENYKEAEQKKETDSELIKQDLLDGVDPDSIVAQRVNEVQRIGQRGGDFDQLALAEVLVAREGAKISIARYIASVLVLLGLCGAIWGLSRLVFKMSPALQQVQEKLDNGSSVQGADNHQPSQPNNVAPVLESFKTLISVMSDSLKNTRTAFYASLTGILTSVMLLLCNWFVSSKQIAFLAAVEYLTATKLIPLFKSPPETAQLLEVVGAFRQGSDYLVKLAEGLDDRESEVDSHLANLFGIVSKFREGAEALQGHQDRVYQAQQEMRDVVDRFMDLTSRIEANQDGAHLDLTGVVEAVRESNKNVSRALEQWQTQQEQLIQRIDETARRAHTETKESREDAQKGIDSVSDLIRTSIDKELSTFRAVAIDLLEQQQVKTRTHFSEVLDRQAAFVLQLQQSIAESDGHKNLVEGLADTIAQERNMFSSGMEKMLHTNEEALKSLMSDQKQLLDISGMRSVEERLEAFMRENQTQSKALMERHSSFAGQFNQLGDRADRLGGMLRLVIGVVAITVPVFAALGVMFIFDLRPADLTMRIVSIGMILAMILALAWLLRSKG
jgi:hypothetical protein